MEQFTKFETHKSFVIWFIIYLRITRTFAAYQLVVPPEYIAFSGEFEFHYQIPVSLPYAFVHVILLKDNQEEEITNVSIDSKYQSGRLKLACGILEVAGKYEFQMRMHEGGPILSRAIVLVRWPKIVLQLPETHLTQSSSVRLKIVSTAVCNPKLNRYKFDINLEYAENSSEISISGKEEILRSQEFSNFSATDLFIEFPCSLFDLSGMYRATLKSSFSAIAVVSRSNTMLATRNPAFKIKLWTNTIHPCFNNMQVDYSLPQCPGNKESNKLRIYVLRRKSSSSLASSIEKSYVQEHLADPDKTYIMLPCDQLQTEAAGYCFQIVTVARHGIIVSQTELCVSAHPDSVIPTDGGWSEWSTWSPCSATCDVGLQSRYRMCNSPTPNFGGAFCEGNSTQKQSCDTFCPESVPLTPLFSPVVMESCACGCHMTDSEGKITASGRCSLTSIWRISVRHLHVIRLNFKYMNLFKQRQSVKVRNGGSADSDLIAYSDGRSEIPQLTSTTNEMLVEFYTESDTDVRANSTYIYPVVPTKPIHVYGFIATYFSTSVIGDGVHASAQPILESESPSIWQSTVTIVGISLCGLVVVTALSFVIYHRTCHKRVHKYAMAAHEESPKHICRPFDIHSSPNHESPVNDNQHDMEIPLTGEHNTFERTKAKTPGSAKSKSSFASACSNNIRKKRVKVDIEAIPSHREYCQIPQDSSPQKLARAREISQDGNHTGFFRASPLIKSKVPRSPKVHPSPKVTKSVLNRTPTHGNYDTLKSKIDLNSSSKQHTVVRGEDYTPTKGFKSPSSEIGKTECETPTNIDKVIYRKRRHKNEIAKVDSDNGKVKQSDIKLQDINKSSEELDRKPASGTSDDSTSAGKELGSLLTTSFIENVSKPRRPTSLTESYSKMSLSSSASKASVDCIKINVNSTKDKTSVTSSDDRQNVLPKPDGQSPKSQRVETIKLESQNCSPAKTSKASTPRSVRSVKSDQTDSSNKTKSPVKSINTPSDVVELEYDDFVDMDDTYSYFDPVVTEKLTWHGVERVKAKTPKDDIA